MAVLEAALLEALAVVQRQPERWLVPVGTQLKPKKQEQYSPVEREKLIQLISDFRGLLSEARRSEGRVIGTGD